MAPERMGPVVGSRALPIQSITFPIPLTEVSRLPNGYPHVLDSPLAWSGGQFTTDSDYVLRLTEGHLEEINHALQQFKGRVVVCDPPFKL